MLLQMLLSIEPMSLAYTARDENHHFPRNSEISMRYWIRKSESETKFLMIFQICSISGSPKDLPPWTTNTRRRRIQRFMKNHLRSVRMQEIPSSTSSDDLEVPSLLVNNSSDELSSWNTNLLLLI